MLGSLVSFSESGLNPLSVEPLPVFVSPPIGASILLGLIYLIFGLALFSLKNKFKKLAPIATILIILSGVFYIFSSLNSTLLFLYSLFNFLSYVLLLIILYKSRQILIGK